MSHRVVGRSCALFSLPARLITWVACAAMLLATRLRLATSLVASPTLQKGCATTRRYYHPSYDGILSSSIHATPQTRASTATLARRRRRASIPLTQLRAVKNRPGNSQQRPAAADLPPMNEEIRFPQLRVVVDRGDQPDEPLGIISRDEALAKAQELGVDLVLIAETSDPPVCKIVNYGKLKYAKEKKKKEQMKKARSNEIKEVKMSYKIGEADYQVRRRAAVKFIQGGMRVKLVIQFRGREQQHMNLGNDLIDRFVTDLADDSAAVAKTKVTREGRDLTTILSGKS